MTGALKLDSGLWAIGASVPAAAADTWAPRTMRGQLPVQCYALCESDRIILIDGGLAVHRDRIAAGLEPLLEGRSTRSILMSRREPDTIGNLPWLVSRYGFNDLILSGILDPLDYFESFEFRATEAHLATLAERKVSWIKSGTALVSDEYHLQLISPLIRVLATDWIYERNSRTLFTSDFGAFLSGRDKDGLFVTDRFNASPSFVAECLATKFDWLRSIDTGPMIDDVLHVFETYDVCRIAPSFGGIVEGRQAVADLVRVTVEALRLLCGVKRTSEVSGFDWSVLQGGRPAAAFDNDEKRRAAS